MEREFSPEEIPGQHTENYYGNDEQPNYNLLPLWVSSSARRPLWCMFLILGQLLACALRLAALLRKLDRDLVRINEFIFRTSVVPHRLRVLKNQAIICRECLATHRTCDKCYCLFGLHYRFVRRISFDSSAAATPAAGFWFFSAWKGSHGELKKLLEKRSQLVMQVSTLLYKAVRTRSLGQRLGARRVVRGNEDDYWGIFGLLYMSSGLQAIKVRHAIIHQHQFRLHGEACRTAWQQSVAVPTSVKLPSSARI